MSLMTGVTWRGFWTLLRGRTGSCDRALRRDPPDTQAWWFVGDVGQVLVKPQEIAAGFAQAWNRGDADAIADLFTKDADFVNVVGFWWTRRDQIRHNHAYGFTHIFPGSTMTIERLRVRELGETAVVHAHWRIEGQRMPDGRADVAPSPRDDGPAGEGGRQDGAPEQGATESSAGERRGIFVFVTQRQDDGRWLAVAAQNTDIVPGAQTLLAGESGLQPTRYDEG